MWGRGVVLTCREAWNSVRVQRKHKETLGPLAGMLKTGNVASVSVWRPIHSLYMATQLGEP